MRRIAWFALLLLLVFLPNGSLEAQEKTTITPRRPPIVGPRFEVDVLVDGRPLSEYESRGRTFVEAIRGEEYEIRLRNRSSDTVAVALSVDGLNTIDASRTSSWNASKWVIQPYQTVTISGWQMDSDSARRFYFTSERDSYAAKLGVRADLGVISAVFYRERRRVVPITPPSCRMPCPVGRADSQSSSDSPMSAEARTAAGATKSSRSKDEAATGIGRSVRHDVEYVDMELDSRPAAEVTICYDYGAPPRGSISESNPKYRVRGKRDN